MNSTKYKFHSEGITKNTIRVTCLTCGDFMGYSKKKHDEHSALLEYRETHECSDSD